MKMKMTEGCRPPGGDMDGPDLPNRGNGTGRNPNDLASSNQIAEGFDTTTVGLNIPPETISFDDGYSFPNYERIDTEYDPATGEERTFDRLRGGFLTRFDEDDTGQEDMGG